MVQAIASCHSADSRAAIAFVLSHFDSWSFCFLIILSTGQMLLVILSPY